MDGSRRRIRGGDGVPIGLLTAGSGPDLLLVHGGMGSIENWRGVWATLTRTRRVTAMDRRGRATSGDADEYTLEREFADVTAVATALAEDGRGPVDVVGHSIGATCVLGAAAAGAPFRRIVLYEPAGPETVARRWPERLAAMVADGQVGRATFTFLTEIVGLSPAEVEALRDEPGGRDVLPVVAATLPREARALAAVDLTGAAGHLRQPVLLVVGATSPPWAHRITAQLAAALASATVTTLPDVGHEALAQAPERLVAALISFLDGRPPA